MKLNIINTNKILSSLALITLLSGFNTKDTDPKMSFIQVASPASRELYKYVNEFVVEGQKRGIQVDRANLASIELVAQIDGHDGSLGVCNEHYDVKRIKILNYLAFDSKNALRNLIFHELGHCLLDLDHSDNPEDIMFSGVNNYSLRHWKESLNRLFDAYKLKIVK